MPGGTPTGAAPPRGRGAGAPRRPFILSVGRLAAYKGTDVLLLAFAGLARLRPGLDLVICGPDQSRGRLARFARRLGLKGRLRLPGDVGAPQVARLLQACSFFVLPSRQENMPMALLEAMAAGKAVAACAVGGVGELVTHGVDGLLVAPQDVSALGRAMRRLAGDAGLRRRLGRQAARRARLFDWKTAAAGYRRLYAA